MTVTRGSVRSFQSICPWPTSTADHVPSAALEQDVREAAGRGADVQAGAAGDVDREHVESVRELEPATTHVRVIRFTQCDLCVVRDARACLRHRLAVDADLSGEDQRARTLARRREPAVHEQHVEPVAWFQCERAVTQCAIAGS